MRAVRRRLLRRAAVLRRKRDEAGYAAVLVAMLFGTVFIGMAAIGVDTAYWYQEAEDVQKAADAAALAGVTYMPNDFTKASSTAIEVATKNGYPNSGSSSVVVSVGSKPSELKVVITKKVKNHFGSAIGVADDWISRAATADFTAPAPMGSPCNSFGNEPRGNTASSSLAPSGTALPSTGGFSQCPKDATTGTSQPQFWAAIEGPETDKVQGDRYNTNNCSETGNGGATYGCSAGKNSEYIATGSFFAIHVEPGMVGKSIELQVYDPAFVLVNSYCNARNTANATNGLPIASEVDATMNEFTNDGKTRYVGWKAYNSTTTDSTAAAKEFCTGDSYPTYVSNKRWTGPVTTSFVLRHQTPTSSPMLGTVINTTSCPITQFRGYGSIPQYAALKSTSNTYNKGLASVWRQWYKLCTFTPDTAGDYFLQVRTNVTIGGTAVANTNSQTPMIYTGNTDATLAVGNTTTGAGSNAFALRAIPTPNTDANKKLISVSGFERMPILQNSPDSTATFNLVRALPNAKGQYLTFDFFDAADGATSGSVKVLPPTDATGSVKNATGVPGCRWGKNATSPASYTSVTNCSVSVAGTMTDGQVIHMVIPIPTDYNCGTANPIPLGDCWFRVQMTYSGAVTDFTTWSASIGGDPVRLIK